MSDSHQYPYVRSRYVESADGEQNAVLLTVNPQTPQATQIVSQVLPEALSHFLSRNKEYGGDKNGGAYVLGSRGQYADLNRKMLKLKRYLWDGEPVPEDAEDVRTILRELVGHCLLTLDCLDDEDSQRDYNKSLGESSQGAGTYRGAGDIAPSATRKLLGGL